MYFVGSTSWCFRLKVMQHESMSSKFVIKYAKRVVRKRITVSEHAHTHTHTNEEKIQGSTRSENMHQLTQRGKCGNDSQNLNNEANYRHICLHPTLQGGDTSRGCFSHLLIWFHIVNGLEGKKTRNRTRLALFWRSGQIENASVEQHQHLLNTVNQLARTSTNAEGQVKLAPS